MRERLILEKSALLIPVMVLLFGAGKIIAAFLLASLLHEIGHLLAIRCFSGKVRTLRLSFTGAEICADVRGGYAREAVISLMGPAASFAAAILLAGWGFYTVAGASFLLGVLNSMPVLSLDGGRALKNLLALTPLGLESRTVVRVISAAASALLIAAGIYVFWKTTVNISLLVLGIFTFLTQRKEPA